MGVLEALASLSGGVAAILEGPAPPAEGLAPSLDLAACGPLPGARTSPPPKLRLLGRCWCSRTAPRVLSATGPLLDHVGTECPAPGGPTATVIFFLGAMIDGVVEDKDGDEDDALRTLSGSDKRAPYLAHQRCQWETTPMGPRGSLLWLQGAGS